MMDRRPKGFIALITMLLLSLFLLESVLTASALSIQTRSHILSLELKLESKALALSCLNKAILELISSNVYAGNENLTIENDSCTIKTVKTENGKKIVESEGVIKNIVTRLHTELDPGTLTIIQSYEIANF